MIGWKFIRVRIASINLKPFFITKSINKNKNIQQRCETGKGRKDDDIRKEGRQHQPALRDRPPSQAGKHHRAGVQL